MKANFRILTVLACAVLVGSAFAQQGQRGGRGFGGRNQTNAVMLLGRTDVQEDLKLSDDQKSKLDELRKSFGNQFGGGRRNRGDNNGGAAPSQTDREAARKAAQERAAEAQKKINEILTPDQQKRLAEIKIQFEGDRAVLDKDVQKQLDLTDDQKTKISDVQKRYTEANQSVMQKVRDGEIDRNQVQEAVQKNEKVLGDELKKILTPAQTDKLKTLAGKEFKRDASLDQRRRGGGRG